MSQVCCFCPKIAHLPSIMIAGNWHTKQNMNLTYLSELNLINFIKYRCIFNIDCAYLFQIAFTKSQKRSLFMSAGRFGAPCGHHRKCKCVQTAWPSWKTYVIPTGGSKHALSSYCTLSSNAIEDLKQMRRHTWPNVSSRHKRCISAHVISPGSAEFKSHQTGLTLWWFHPSARTGQLLGCERNNNGCPKIERHACGTFGPWVRHVWSTWTGDGARPLKEQRHHRNTLYTIRW